MVIINRYFPYNHLLITIHRLQEKTRPGPQLRKELPGRLPEAGAVGGSHQGAEAHLKSMDFSRMVRCWLVKVVNH